MNRYEKLPRHFIWGFALTFLILGILVGLLPFLGSIALAFALMMFITHLSSVPTVLLWISCAAAGQYVMGTIIMGSRTWALRQAVFFIIISLLSWLYLMIMKNKRKLRNEPHSCGRECDTGS